MVSVYRGTGRVSYFALLNVSDVLVSLANLAGTGHANLRETFEQTFVYILVLVKKKRMETLTYGCCHFAFYFAMLTLF